MAPNTRGARTGTASEHLACELGTNAFASVRVLRWAQIAEVTVSRESDVCGYRGHLIHGGEDSTTSTESVARR